jgi:hypothetical protein
MWGSSIGRCARCLGQASSLGDAHVGALLAKAPAVSRARTSFVASRCRRGLPWTGNDAIRRLVEAGTDALIAFVDVWECSTVTRGRGV